MKYTVLLFVILVSGCATCVIPQGEYSSSTGSEYNFSLNLGMDEYSLDHQRWFPGGYESRTSSVSSGKWSCAGNTARFELGENTLAAVFREIGVNPFGLSESTKALVFKSTKGHELAGEILYPSGVFN